MRKRNKFIKTFSKYIVVLYLAELLFRLLNGLSIFSVDLLIIFIGLTIVSSFFSFLTMFLSLKSNRRINNIILFLIITYIIFELGFLNYLGVYASINAKTQLDAVKDFIIDFFTSFKLRYLLIYLPFFIYNVLSKQKNNKTFKNMFQFNFILKEHIKYTCISMVLLISNIIIYHNFVLLKQDNLEMFLTASNPDLSVKKFGVVGYGISDIFSYLNEDLEFVDNIVINKPTEFTPESRVFDDTLHLKLIEQETNNTIKLIHKYLLNRNTTSTNEFTGIFENKNLIVVMMESVNDVILNQDHFPNFKRLMNNGIYFNNNYSPRNSCPTGNNEFSGITGLHSIYNNCTTNIYKNNKYPYSIFNLFKEKDYHVVGMHNYTEDYYSRKTTHVNYGADKYYGIERLNIPYSRAYEEWSSDKDFAISAMKIIKENYLDKPFMTWMTTVSAHQPYHVSSIEGNLYLDFFEDLAFPKTFKRYLSKVKVTDDFFGVLLDELEELNILDDTVIILFGDHYAYGYKNNKIYEEYLKREFSGFEVDKVPFLIYNTSLTKEINESYTTFMNIAPTIGNLFNLNFDPRFYFGQDIFSKEYKSYALFPDNSWINEKAIFNSKTNKIEYLSDFVYTSNEVNDLNELIRNDKKISNLIIRYDYFNKLNFNLKKLKEQNEISNSGIAS